MGILNPNCASSQHIDTEPLDGDEFGLALLLATAANNALDTYRSTGEPSDLANWRAARFQYGVEMARWRGIGEAMSARTMVNIVSHFTDGAPDTSTPEGEAYWADVAEAAELGVPNAVGVQR